MRDLRTELEEFDGYPPSWRFKEGDIVVGRILSYQQAQTNYGPGWVCVIEEEKLGRLSIWLTSVVLVDCFRKLKPRIGERIGIRCLGRDPMKDYWRFALKVDRPQAEPDFETMQGWDRPPQEDPPF